MIEAEADIHRATQPGAMQGEIYAYGFSWRKRAFVRRFTGRNDVRFVRDPSRIPDGASLLLWGSAGIPDDLPRGVRIVRLEDGFLRSVGLGAALTSPMSWVIDTRGMYYDAARPSDLEHLLQDTRFSATLLARAEALRQRIVSSGLTKYNVGSRSWQRPAGEKQVILVPGQVEADASIKQGAPVCATNIGLLRAVRITHPSAYIVYKPHPDVVDGWRKDGHREHQAAMWCNEIVTAASMNEMLRQVDAVHVLTSLSGFEALLRGVPVTCHGQPFYAGWGLTSDLVPLARRTRRITLPELVAATLILYPTYVSRRTGGITTPEAAIDELLAWRADGERRYGAMAGMLLRAGLRLWEARR